MRHTGNKQVQQFCRHVRKNRIDSKNVLCKVQADLAATSLDVIGVAPSAHGRRFDGLHEFAKRHQKDAQKASKPLSARSDVYSPFRTFPPYYSLQRL